MAPFTEKFDKTVITMCNTSFPIIYPFSII